MRSGNLPKCVVIALFVILQTNLAQGYCSETLCGLSSSYYDYCCRDDSCCSYSQYISEQAVDDVSSILTLSVGAIVGIVVGVIVLIILCIVACVCCCCQSNRTSQGRVVTTMTATQPVVVQQQYPNQPVYPMGQQTYLPQPQPQPYLAQSAQTPYNPTFYSGDQPPPYSTKSN